MVWIRWDGYCQPLNPRYEGPFHVLEGHPKFFKFQLGEKQDTISIDPLKPVTLPEGTQPPSHPGIGRGGGPPKTLLQQPKRWWNQQRRRSLSHGQYRRRVLLDQGAEFASRFVWVFTALGGGPIAYSEPRSKLATQLITEENVPLFHFPAEIYSVDQEISKRSDAL